MDSTETTPATAPFDDLPIHIRITGDPPEAAIWRGEDGWSPWSGALVLDVLDSREAVETGLEELLTRPAPRT